MIVSVQEIVWLLVECKEVKEYMLVGCTEGTDVASRVTSVHQMLPWNCRLCSIHSSSVLLPMNLMVDCDIVNVTLNNEGVPAVM